MISQLLFEKYFLELKFVEGKLMQLVISCLFRLYELIEWHYINLDKGEKMKKVVNKMT